MDIKSRSLDTYVEIFNKYSDDVTLVRELDVDDYDKGYYELLGSFFKAPKPKKEEYASLLRSIKAESPAHVIVVFEDRQTNTIVCSGTVFMERKFTRGHSQAAHLEEIIVSKDHRSRGYGKKDIAWKENAYKIFLDCEESARGFYQKVGFSDGGYQMKEYNPSL